MTSDFEGACRLPIIRPSLKQAILGREFWPRILAANFWQ